MKIQNDSVNFFIDNKKEIEAKNEGVSSGSLAHKGNNYFDYNKQTTTTDRGRRKVDYIKFSKISESRKKVLASFLPGRRKTFKNMIFISYTP